MKKYTVLCLIMLFTLFGFNNISYCLTKNANVKTSIYVNNVNDKDIKIEITNIETIKNTINLDEIHEAYSIITMNITNIGLDYVELSNINYDIYQGHEKLQTFVESQNKYLGFVGTLKSGESKEIKIGVVLKEKNAPLKLIFENLSDIKQEKTIKIINI